MFADSRKTPRRAVFLASRPAQELLDLKLCPPDKTANISPALKMRPAIGAVFQAVLIAGLAAAFTPDLHSNLVFLPGVWGRYVLGSVLLCRARGPVRGLFGGLP